jgi:hypothetical protein
MEELGCYVCHHIVAPNTHMIIDVNHVNALVCKECYDALQNYTYGSRFDTGEDYG